MVFGKEKNNEPGVSVIIPTYNRAHFIGRAIESVLNQTYQNFEIIVIDGNSKDNTEEVVKRFDDERIRYLRYETNRGGAVARNSGIKEAQAEYIGFLDDDDEWLPEKLEKQMDVFETTSSEVGVVYSGFSMRSGKSGEVIADSIPTHRGNVYDSILARNILGGSTIPLIKKICFQKVGVFDEELPCCEDWDLWIRLSKHYDFDFVPEVLIKYYVHGEQISVDLNRMIMARQRLIEKFWDELSQKPRILSILLIRLGILFSIARDSKMARKYLFASIEKWPLLASTYVHIIFLVMVPRLHRAISDKWFIFKFDGIKLYF